MVLVEAALPDALEMRWLRWVNVCFVDSGPVLSPGLGHCGGDRSACALSCLGWGSPGTWSLAWCPQGETVGVMLHLSSEVASQTSPGQYHQGEHVLSSTAGELSFLLFLFLFAFITQVWIPVAFALLLTIHKPK